MYLSHYEMNISTIASYYLSVLFLHCVTRLISRPQNPPPDDARMKWTKARRSHSGPQALLSFSLPDRRYTCTLIKLNLDDEKIEKEHFFTVKTHVWCVQSCQVHKEKAIKSSCECSCASLFHSACMWAFKIVFFFSHTINICLMCFETWGTHHDSLTHGWLKVVSSSAHFPSLSHPPPRIPASLVLF